MPDYAGPVLVVLALLAVPPMILMTGAVLAAVFGYLFKTEAEATHEGSELIETNY